MLIRVIPSGADRKPRPLSILGIEGVILTVLLGLHDIVVACEMVFLESSTCDSLSGNKELLWHIQLKSSSRIRSIWTQYYLNH